MAGKTSSLVDPEFTKSVAELYVNGTTQKEMAEILMCSVSSVRAWIKDPRVQAEVRTLAVERVTRISRKIDGEIEARLAFIHDWDLEMVIKLRKEMLDRPLKIADEEGDLGKVSNELAEAMDANPELQKIFTELASKS